VSTTAAQLAQEHAAHERAAGLYTGDQRLWLDQVFGLGGWVCIQQDLPYPATLLSILPELAQGDVI